MRPSKTIDQHDATEGSQERRQASRPFRHPEELIGNRDQPIKENGFVQNRVKILVRRNPVVQHENFPSLFGVATLVGLEKCCAPQLIDQNKSNCRRQEPWQPIIEKVAARARIRRIGDRCGARQWTSSQEVNEQVYLRTVDLQGIKHFPGNSVRATHCSRGCALRRLTSLTLYRSVIFAAGGDVCSAVLAP